MSSNQDSGRKLALVTGGARRIGAAICSTLHEQGYDIVCTFFRSDREADALARRLNQARPDSAWAYALDLSCVPAIESLAEAVGRRHARLDTLINNASGYYPTDIGEVNENNWKELFDSNARGPLFLCRSLRHLLAASRGSIVNLLDADVERAIPGHTVYGMAKAALAAMTRSLALELAPQVRVNAVAPGSILWSDAEENNLLYQKQEIDRCFLGRTGTPGEVAEAVRWLAGCATYTTGSVIYVDGGRHLHR